MKRFHDIRIRRHHSRPIVQADDESGFWHGVSDEIRPRRKMNEKLKGAILKGSFVAILLCTFFAFSLVRAYDTKSRVEILTENAKIYLDSAFTSLEQGDYGGAMTEAEKADSNLKIIKLNMQSWGQDIKYLSLISNKHSAIVNLEMTLDAANLILSTVDDSQNNLSKMLNAELVKDSTSGGDQNFAIDIEKASKTFEKTINQSYSNLDKSEKIINRINVDELPGFKNSLEKARSAVSTAKKSIEGSKILASRDLPWISGANGGKRNFLLIFQNNAELRGGSGGSFGSFGIVHFEDGRYTGIDFGTNIYKIDHAFEAKTQIAPPEDLKWVVSDNTWALKDAGWAVDGPQAFEKIRWFYEEETGNKIDGVFTIDTSAFIDILRLIGQIELPSYGKTIDANNFRAETEEAVHQTYFDTPGAIEENEPKKILSDMMPIVIERLLKKISEDGGLVNVIKTFSDTLSQKHIMIYTFDKDIQNDLNKYNISGQIIPSSGDYLYINNSNLNGMKSSLSMKQNVVLDSVIDQDGNVTNTVEITRIHQGTNDWPDGTNKNMIRMILPENAKIISFEQLAGNFEQDFDKGYKNNAPYWIGEESDNFPLTFWMNTEAKTESKVRIKYTFTPKSISDTGYFDSIFQRQPGANTDSMIYKIHFPNDIIPQNLKGFNSETDTFETNFELVKDTKFHIKVSKK